MSAVFYNHEMEAEMRERNIQWQFKGNVVCYTAVFSVVTQRSSLRDDTKNGCVAVQGKR